MSTTYPLLDYALDILSSEDLAIISPQTLSIKEDWYKGAATGLTWTFIMIAELLNSYPSDIDIL